MQASNCLCVHSPAGPCHSSMQALQGRVRPPSESARILVSPLRDPGPSCSPPNRRPSMTGSRHCRKVSPAKSPTPVPSRCCRSRLGGLRSGEGRSGRMVDPGRSGGSLRQRHRGVRSGSGRMAAGAFAVDSEGPAIRDRSGLGLRGPLPPLTESKGRRVKMPICARYGCLLPTLETATVSCGATPCSCEGQPHYAEPWCAEIVSVHKPDGSRQNEETTSYD